MPDNVFIDTNLIIYSYSNNDQIREIIEDIFNSSIIIISTQVLNETANILLKKMKVEEDKVIEVIEELREKFQIANINFRTVIKALLISKKYKYSYYDSLVISTALENDCKILYSEDMQHGQIINKTLKIINPFK